MITGPALYILIGISLACYSGQHIVHGVQAAGRKIATVFHHHKRTH